MTDTHPNHSDPAPAQSQPPAQEEKNSDDQTFSGSSLDSSVSSEPSPSPPETVCELPSIQTKQHSVPPKFQFTDYYDLLDIPADASHETVTQAVTSLLHEHHPDASPYDQPIATDLFMICSEVEDILTHPNRREAYDTLGHTQYITQSQEAGAFVTETLSSDDTQSSPPESSSTHPDTNDTVGSQMSSRQHHLSHTGQTVLSGGPLIGYPPAAQNSGAISADQTGSGSTSESATQSDQSEQATYSAWSLLPTHAGTSTRYLRAAWRQVWQFTLTATVVTAFIVFCSLTALRSVTWSAIPSTPAPSLEFCALSAGSVFVLSTLYFNSVYELSTPRGRFVSDTPGPQFSTQRGFLRLKRGLFAGSVTLVFSLSAASTGTSPWDSASHNLRQAGVSGAAPATQDATWLPGFAAPSQYPPVIDLSLSLVWLASALVSIYFLVTGLSLLSWAARYIESTRTHPLIVELFTHICLTTLGIGLLAPQALLSQSIQPPSFAHSLPDVILVLGGLHDGSVTQATILSLAFGCLLGGTLVYLSRLFLGQTLHRLTSSHG